MSAIIGRRTAMLTTAAGLVAAASARAQDAPVVATTAGKLRVRPRTA